MNGPGERAHDGGLVDNKPANWKGLRLEHGRTTFAYAIEGVDAESLKARIAGSLDEGCASSKSGCRLGQSFRGSDVAPYTFDETGILARQTSIAIPPSLIFGARLQWECSTTFEDTGEDAAAEVKPGTILLITTIPKRVGECLIHARFMATKLKFQRRHLKSVRRARMCGDDSLCKDPHSDGSHLAGSTAAHCSI